ncbi:MAG TPA: hypothetical protein VN634_21695 [Candidatus Limnocylindrales bacterium]|nr:hypothetical protein [Candidatus Limnocylindrales bacterium]
MKRNTAERLLAAIPVASYVIISLPHCRWMDAHFEQVIRDWGYACTAVGTVVADGYAADVATYRLEDPAR